MIWAWSVDNTAPATTVIFELMPEADSARLRLTHRGEIDPFAGALIRDGWPEKIEASRRTLERS
jgi:hypothetical protein